MSIPNHESIRNRLDLTQEKLERRSRRVAALPQSLIVHVLLLLSIGLHR